MGYPTGRVILYDRLGNPLGDLDPTTIRELVMVEEVNGEHTLTVRTTTVLAERTYALMCDETGKWREWCVNAIDEGHASGRYAVGTYVLPWSLFVDLMGTPGGVRWASSEEGTHDPVAASYALGVALANSARWEVGTVTVTRTAGVSLYDGQVWNYLQKLREAFGGEFDAEIGVDATGVVSRRVALLAHQGSERVTRRFDYARDMTSIRRMPADGPYYCGIEPRGGGSKTDSEGVDYSDRCGIEEEPASEGHAAGSPYLFDEEAKEVFKVSDGHGGYEYPTLTVCYDLDTDGDQEELLNKALADLHGYTRPSVMYEADVLQLAEAGLDWQGVALGDEIQCADRGFNPTASLRVQGRVMRIEQDPRRPRETTHLTIGSLGDSLAETIRGLAGAANASLASRVGQIESGGTIVYLQDLLDQLNAELNVTGGYYYFVPGHGILTYDRAVTDPLVGTEATQVTQIVGGGIRIANSRTSGGDWDWKTVFESGHIASGLVTAASIVAGTIGSANGSFFLDLDNNAIRIGGRSWQDTLDDISDASRMATDYLTYMNGELVLGAIGSAVKNVLTNSRMSFRTASGDVAWFGLNESDIWEMFIDTARVQNRLGFGDFYWFARSNGNMTLKWTKA